MSLKQVTAVGAGAIAHSAWPASTPASIVDPPGSTRISPASPWRVIASTYPCSLASAIG